jgi:hypothetical protein
MRVSNHFVQRLKERFDMNIEILFEEFQYSKIERYVNNQRIPFKHLLNKFKKYPQSELLCIEELNMCIVIDPKNQTLITVLKIFI